MTASLLDGKIVAKKIQKELKQLTQYKLETRSRPPSLAVVLLGQDPASTIYVSKKHQACKRVGFQSYEYTLSYGTSEKELLSLIHELNVSPDVDGILVQLPLPSHINTQAIIEAIHPDKDVDGFHPYNLGRLAQRCPLHRPCTPYGIIQLLNAYELKLPGQHAVIVGTSNIVGKPMGLELLMAGATVTLCHSQTRDLKKHVCMADLIVVATGTPDCVQPDWLRPHQILIDVGIHRLPNNTLRGDIDFEQAQHRVAWITPVPGGVGPMTVATLLQNTFTAYEHHTRSGSCQS